MKRKMAALIGTIAILAVLGCFWIRIRDGRAPVHAGGLPFTVGKDTTAITAPLRADGVPDYVAALNQIYGKGVTSENNGFVVWLKVVGTGEKILDPKIKERVLKMCGAEGTPAGAELWEGYSDYLKRTKGWDEDTVYEAEKGLSDAGGELWIEAQRPEVAGYLKAREKQLALVTEAAAKPRWWMPYVSAGEPAVMTTGFTISQPIREAFNALCARATLRIKDGDFAGFLSDVTAARRLARHVAGAMVIERLAAAAMESQTYVTIGVAAGSGSLNAAQCEEVEKMLDAVEPSPPMAEALDTCERWMDLDATISAAMTAKAVAGTSKIDVQRVDWDLILKRINGLLDDDLAAMKMPLRAQRQAAFAKMQEELDREMAWKPGWKDDLSGLVSGTRALYTRAIGDMLIAILAPATLKVDEMWRQAAMQSAMLHLVLAATKFKSITGGWPKTLDELVPAYVKALPKDMYTANEAEGFRYQVTKAGVKVYSIGPNGKDDGGVNDHEKQMDDIAIGVK